MALNLKLTKNAEEKWIYDKLQSVAHSTNELSAHTQGLDDVKFH